MKRYGVLARGLTIPRRDVCVIIRGIGQRDQDEASDLVDELHKALAEVRAEELAAAVEMGLEHRTALPCVAKVVAARQREIDCSSWARIAASCASLGAWNHFVFEAAMRKTADHLAEFSERDRMTMLNALAQYRAARGSGLTHDPVVMEKAPVSEAEEKHRHRLNRSAYGY